MGVARQAIAGMIDHTLLNAAALPKDIEQLCNEAKRYRFAAVCINSCYVPLAYKLLSETGVAVCTVIGFPLGSVLTAAKAFEAGEAVKAGAKEVDMVINIGALKSKQHNEVLRDIRAVVEKVQSINESAIVKVIIETCYLTREEKIAACRLAVEAGASFVKTSTGFGSGGATLEDVELMRSVVGFDIGVKASGGIKSASQALSMLEAGASRIGASAGVNIIKGLNK